MKILMENRKARAEYTIVDTFEAGIVLSGPEVKMIRLKRGSLVGSHVRVIAGQAILLNMQIPAYPNARQEEYDPKQTRKLLLHKNELLKLQHAQETKGLALIPLAIGISHRFVKVQIAIAKGKKQYERREELKKRDMAREVERTTKQRMR